jgi:hypothetical protein
MAKLAQLSLIGLGAPRKMTGVAHRRQRGKALLLLPAFLPSFFFPSTPASMLHARHLSTSSSGKSSLPSFGELSQQIPEMSTHTDGNFSHRPLLKAALYSLESVLEQINAVMLQDLQSRTVGDSRSTFERQIRLVLRSLVRTDNGTIYSIRVVSTACTPSFDLLAYVLVGVAGCWTSGNRSSSRALLICNSRG